LVRVQIDSTRATVVEHLSAADELAKGKAMEKILRQ